MNPTQSSIRGFEDFRINLAKVYAQIGRNTALGLDAAGRFLEADANKRVPIEFGPLRASSYSVGNGGSFDRKIYVGFSAKYALWVHEAVGMKLLGQKRRRRGGGPPPIGRYWDPQPQAQPKFLEQPARELSPEMARIIQSFASLGLL